MTEVELSLRIEASPSTVFRYFVDPGRMRQWMGVAIDVDPRPGGQYRVDVTGGDVAAGTFLEVVPDERIVWTWGWEGNDGLPPGSTTIEVVLTPQDDATVVKFRHFDLPDDGAAVRHREGWDHYLPRLVVAAAGGNPGPDDYLPPAPSAEGPSA